MVSEMGCGPRNRCFEQVGALLRFRVIELAALGGERVVQRRSRKTGQNQHEQPEPDGAPRATSAQAREPFRRK